MEVVLFMYGGIMHGMSMDKGHFPNYEFDLIVGLSSEVIVVPKENYTKDGMRWRARVFQDMSKISRH